MRTFMLMIVAVSSGAGVPTQADEVEVAPHRLLDMRFRQLMLDERVITRNEGCRKIYPQVHKDQRVLLRPTEPHERAQRCLFLYGTVLHDARESRFRMWYQVVCGTRKRDAAVPYDYHMAYAESPDGLNWEKPRLGQVDYFGDGGQNNLLLRPGSMPHVFEDDSVEPYRYRFYFPHPHRVAFSRDGRSIERVQKIVAKRDIPNQLQMLAAHGKLISDGVNIAYDPVDGLWRGVFKTWQPLSGSINPDTWRRSQALATSRDGLAWKFSGRILSADLADDRYVDEQRPKQHPERPAWAELYQFPLFRYEGLLIGLPGLFYQLDGLRDGEDAEVFLSWSNDGLNWQRPLKRQPLIANGPDEGPDDGFLVCAVSPPLRRDNELWIYYTANPHPHVYPFKAPGEPTFRLGRLRVDGWAGYRAGAEEGLLETRPLVAGGKLRMNADCTQGKLRVEVHEVIAAPTGQPLRTRLIPGFAKADCPPLTGDLMQMPVRWKSASWDQLQGKTVVLRFILRDATLYSFATAAGHP